MEVVARQKGYYGGVRAVGDAFSVSDPLHFSERWMYKAASPEGKALLSATLAAKSVVRSGRPSRDQLTGELVQAGGATAMVLELTRQIEDLNRENAELKARLAGAAEETDRSDTADAVSAAGPDAGQAADFTSGSDRQRRRRARNSE